MTACSRVIREAIQGGGGPGGAQQCGGLSLEEREATAIGGISLEEREATAWGQNKTSRWSWQDDPGCLWPTAAVTGHSIPGWLGNTVNRLLSVSP